ncbi:MAG: LysE family translocator [Chloroflexi bacterium]|nr:LysE family translocator [Chloroflexota bacterium]
MPDAAAFGLFLAAAVVLAITPGPGIFYVLARSIKGGRREGYASAAGTAVGGLFHVAAAALGVSALLATSAVAFSVVKYIGAAYLIYLGIRALLSKDAPVELDDSERRASKRAFYQGITTEVLNPKTALFFLAFIPQFINPRGVVVLEFLLLGSISVLLNSSVDMVVATLAGPIGVQLKRRARLRQAQRMFSGFSLIALGAYVALSGEKNS